MADGKGKSFLVLLLLDTLLLRGKDTCRGKERRSIDGYDRNDFLQKKGYDNERDYSLYRQREREKEVEVEMTYLFTSSFWV